MMLRDSGAFALIQMKRAKKNEWLLIKHRDEAADEALAD